MFNALLSVCNINNDQEKKSLYPYQYHATNEIKHQIYELSASLVKQNIVQLSETLLLKIIKNLIQLDDDDDKKVDKVKQRQSAIINVLTAMKANKQGLKHYEICIKLAMIKQFYDVTVYCYSKIAAYNLMIDHYIKACQSNHCNIQANDLYNYLHQYILIDQVNNEQLRTYISLNVYLN